jgi:uncharacterized YccA/Bax inhibitor family protein
MMLGLFGGFIFALITIFKSSWAMVTAPVYALCEGLFLGGISAIFNKAYPGIAFQAVALTFGVLFLMLTLYKTGTIKVTDKFRMGVIAATGSILLIYILTLVLSLFGVRVPYIHEGGAVGIGFSLIVVGIAALNLVLDFDFFDKGEQAKLPKKMEWYAAFGLMVTLIWLYIEILILLSKIRER